ncbi:MAG TPA: DUF2950 domain-containing protein [Steroidobacteraceae bacterium]|nr:DUF2950 domain-containing protein [Steroidobacteraceae bacterium]
MSGVRVSCVLGLILGGLLSAVMAAEPAATPAMATSAKASAGKAGAAGAQTFESAEKAADALVDAAEKFDVTSLIRIVGTQGEDLILTGEYAQDRERSQEFAAQARNKKHVAVDPKNEARAYLLVGEEDWPFALPIVKHNGRWSFDAAGGRQELMYRRIGSNELDAIDICEGYVDAQFDFAYRKRQGYEPSQYAQRIISNPGKQDGLAWQNPDGSWGGPIGEKIANAIEQGYNLKAEPYHGYFFKVLKSQGPAAPLGAMDYVVEGIMIGGFALIAAPAEYGETGLKTFMVSHTGVVYEKDLGPTTLEEFQKMERFNPDKSWTPVVPQ